MDAECAALSGHPSTRSEDLRKTVSDMVTISDGPADSAGDTRAERDRAPDGVAMKRPVDEPGPDVESLADQREIDAEVRDTIADERDRAADERDHVAAQRDRTADEQEHFLQARWNAAAYRDAAAARRDRVADERDRVAEDRDRVADDRDRRADQREIDVEMQKSRDRGWAGRR